MPVQTSSGGSTESVTGPGPSRRPREGRPAPNPQRGMEGRIRPQRRDSGGPKAQVAGPLRPLYRTTPGRGNIVGEDRSHPYGPRSTQGVEGDEGQERVRGSRQLDHPPPQTMVRSGERHQGQPTPPHQVSGGFGGGVFSSAARDFGSAYMGGAYGGGGGHASGGPEHYGPTNGRSHRGHGGTGSRGGRGGGSKRGPAVCRKCTLAGWTSTNHPLTICPLNECFMCGTSGHVHQFCPNG